MELDLALLAAAEAGEGPFLRLYAWDGPWVSLGYFQKGPVREGIAVVRRPTGGKALLHDRDLTYAVALPATHPLAQVKLVDSYRALSRFLVTALESIGVEATLGLFPEEIDTRGRRRDAPCATEVHVDTVLVNDRKLIGSAQVRRKGAVLQHGSIPLSASTPAVLSGLLPPGQDVDEPWLAWYHGRTTTLDREGFAGCGEALQVALLAAFREL